MSSLRGRELLSTLALDRFAFLQAKLSIMSTSDPTFRNYTFVQAGSYASLRGSYHHELYKEIIRYHEKTGGHATSLLDVGCGTGNATRPLALNFRHALGIDPGEQMILAALRQSGMTAAGEKIKYAVAGAEDLLGIEGIEEASVDLVAAAMAVCAASTRSKSNSLLKGC